MPEPIDNNTPEQMVNDPSSQLFASLADFYRENGLFPEAIAICQAGLESQPDNLDGRLVMAKCLMATKQFGLARAEAAKVLSVQSENSEAKRILAQADSAVPEPPLSAATPDKAETATAEESLPEIKPAAEPAVPKAAAPTEKPDPEPVPMPEPSAREVPANPLPLMAGRAASQPSMDGKADDQQEINQPAFTATPAVSVPSQKPEAEGSSEWQAGFGKIMNDLVQTPQIKACMLVDESGYAVADAVSRQGQSLSEDTAALSANIFKTAFEAMKKIKLGELERIVIETSAEKIFLRQAGRMVLLISADVSAKVGLVMVNSKRAAEQADNLAKKAPGR